MLPEEMKNELAIGELEPTIQDECPMCGSIDYEENFKWTYTVCICSECLHEWVEEDG